MNYLKANKILPEALLKEIQKYIQGETLYIPKTKNNYQKWGTRSGGRALIKNRNDKIKNAFISGQSINDLSMKYHLSVSTIKKIIYTK